MNDVWKTKFGRRRVRHDPPTLEEAIVAASGLSDDVDAQIEIAASLMELSPDEVRAQMPKAAPPPKANNTVVFINRSGGPRSVVVERKPSRRLINVKPVR